MTIKKYLTKLCEYTDLDKNDFKISIEESEEKINVFLEVSEDQAGYFIGFKGETLDAIEYMLRTVFRDEEERKIILDVNGYKQQKEEKLKDQIAEVANQVLETGKAKRIFSLNSYERFLVHSMLSEEEGFEGLESYSEDDYDGSRVLVIKLKD